MRIFLILETVFYCNDLRTRWIQNIEGGDEKRGNK